MHLPLDKYIFFQYLLLNELNEFKLVAETINFVGQLTNGWTQENSCDCTNQPTVSCQMDTV